MCAPGTMDHTALGRDGGAPRAGTRPPDVTALLIDWRGGNDRAVHQLVHDELRRLARLL